MVLVVNEWEELKGYISNYPMAEIFYKVDFLDEERSRLRVLSGRLGLDQVIKDKEQLEAMVRFLDERGGKAIVNQRDDDTFFL
jgi:hypothetical protein